MFTVVLFEPQIPPNTGNIARLCAATNIELVIAGQTGFSLDDRYLKRAGLDYWEFVRIKHHHDAHTFFDRLDMNHTYLLSSKVDRPYTSIKPQPGDTFVFGSETHGLPKWLLNQQQAAGLTIPMPNTNVRCLNLATSVGIVMYHMLAQYNFGIENGE